MFGFSFLCQSHPLFISCLGQQHSLKRTFRNQSSRTSTHQYGNNMLSQQYFVAISSIACVLKYWLFETTYPLFTTVNNFKYLCQLRSVEALYEMQSHLYEITTPAQFLPVNDCFISLGTYQTVVRPSWVWQFGFHVVLWSGYLSKLLATATS